jgi:hypothetical protein
LFDYISAFVVVDEGFGLTTILQTITILFRNQNSPSQNIQLAPARAKFGNFIIILTCFADGKAQLDGTFQSSKPLAKQNNFFILSTAFSLPSSSITLVQRY